MANAYGSAPCGHLSIFLGPMYSGKTSKLIEVCNNYTKTGTRVLVINYANDNRYTDKPSLVSHDKISVPCILVSKLSDVFCMNEASEKIESNNDNSNNDNIINHNMNRFMIAEVIIINECQFFPDIVEWVKMAVNTYNKRVYIGGLDGDFERKPFGNWLDLVLFCDSITKLSSNCGLCKISNAIFSHRLTKEKEQIVIGNNYIPLCRQCYDILN